MFSKSRLLLSVFFANVIWLGVLASPAAAAPTIGQGSCDSNNACAFQNGGYAGSVADFIPCPPDWYCGVGDFTQWWYYNTSVSPDNRTSSMKSRGTSFNHTMYAQFNHGGGSFICQPAGVSFSRGTLETLDFDDKASSMWNSDYSDCG